MNSKLSFATTPTHEATAKRSRRFRDNCKTIFWKSVSAFLGITCLAFASCAEPRPISYLNVTVDSHRSKTTCFFKPSDNVKENQLLFGEVEGYLSKIFTLKGFAVVNDEKTADLTILVDWAMSDPKTNYKSEAIYGQTGVSSATTTTTKLGNMTTSQTNFTPSYGVTGYGISSQTTYSRRIKLIAYDNRVQLKTGEAKQVFFLTADSTGSGDDMRRIIPYMLTAMKDYIGVNSRGKLSLYVPIIPETIQYLQEGVSPQTTQNDDRDNSDDRSGSPWGRRPPPRRVK